MDLSKIRLIAALCWAAAGATAAETPRVVAIQQAPGLTLKHAVLLMGDQQGGDIGLEVAVLARKEGVPGVRVLTTAELSRVPAEIFVAEGAAVDVLLYVLDPEGEVVTHAAGRIPIAEGQHAGGVRLLQGLKMELDVDLELGAHQIRVLVAAGPHLGVRFVPLSLSNGFVESTPVFLGGEWTGLAATTMSPSPGEAELRLLTRAVHRFEAVSNQPVMIAASPQVPRALELVADDGSTSLSIPLRAADEVSRDDGSGLRRMIADLSAVAAGVWRARTVRHEPNGDNTGSAWTTIHVVPHDSAPSLVLAPPAPSPEESGPEEIPQDEYLSALRELGRGSWPTALVKVDEFETRWTTRADDAAVREAQLATLESLGDPRAFVPAFALHAELLTQRLTDRRFPRAAHARVLCHAIAERYLEARGWVEGRFDYARMLTILASRVMRAGMRGFSRDLLVRSLELDSSNAVALALLAVAEEEHGDRHQAVARLRQLLNVEPDNRAAQLRLAVNLLRLERYAQGRSILRDLTNEREVDWVAPIAHQELAREELRRGRVSSAEATLQAGIDSLPHDPGLQAMLADLHVRRGEIRAAMDSLEDSYTTEDSASPRLLYARWPERRLESEWDRFRTQADAWTQSIEIADSGP